MDELFRTPPTLSSPTESLNIFWSSVAVFYGGGWNQLSSGFYEESGRQLHIDIGTS
jgi:hypothetical protein